MLFFLKGINAQAQRSSLSLNFLGRFRYSFICQGTSTKRQQSDLFGFLVKLPPVTTNLVHSKVEAIPLSALLRDTTSELAGLSPH